ncbi:MAG: N-acetylgalactosamine 6-sulfatase [Candidatus Synechococcus spongiarum 15L]|uniref:N-acetylgalactosamine 6-sulfatase n=1 Tax=Candidatus Synechococcus spongiarum 15L TaxID=1608419 RepID=A0A0G8AYM8_9SYNE|nr:MAG: N-acetylgalactosamine 6-sulfatase [Candidatus Synechococcus spongiarum 15L]
MVDYSCAKRPRHTFLLPLLILVFSGCSTSDQETDMPPNIIYIMADDLGYGDLGSYGQTTIQTPRLDQMAAEGIRFTSHYAGSTVCAPSRCVLMTGLHSGHCRIRGNARLPLEDEDVTVAEVLQDAGYATGLVGKWGLGEAGSPGIPNRQGFDYFYGYLNQVHAHNFYPEFLWRDTTQVALQNEVVAVGNFGGYATKRVDYSHDLFTEEALAFIDRHTDGPFFLYLAYTIPHANNESRHGGLHGMEVPDYGIYADMDWEDAHKGTAAMISRLDRDVGRLLDHLAAQGIDDNTLVVFTSDNGPHREGGRDPELFDSSGPLRGIKRALYEGGIRVPLIARWPERIAAGTVSDHPSAFWDFLSTAAEIAGVEAPETDGLSYLPALAGENQEAHDHLYWEFHEGAAPTQAVRSGNYKAVYFHESGVTELYDLEQDLGETIDLSAQMPGLADSLVELMRHARTPNERWSITWTTTELP